MADVLVDENIDLDDDGAVIRALIEAGFKTSVINVFRDEAVEEARFWRADDEIGGRK